PIYSRKKGTLDAPEELLFDCNEMAKSYAYFSLGRISISQDNTLAAFSTDTISRRQYKIQIKKLVTSEIYPEKIINTRGSVTWTNDNATLFYTRKDKVTLRSYKVFRHKLHTNVKEDIELYHETDETFNTFVYKTKSRKYIVIGSSSTLTSEYRILNSDTPNGDFKIFSERERNLEYSI